MPRNTHAIIHLDAIKANYQLAVQSSPHSKTIAVIKANAYGHGSNEVAKILEPLVPAFAVAIIEEAVILRKAGINKPILILQGISDSEELEYAAIHNIWPMVTNEQQLNLILTTLVKPSLNVWLKLDTGMHRLGFNPSNLKNCYEKLKKCRWVADEMVLCSHLSTASDVESIHSQQQLELYNEAVSKLPVQNSLANSAAILAFPELHLDWNRPGIMLYGLSPFDQRHPKDQLLQPAMSFISSVIGIRKIPVGDKVGYNGIWKAEKPSIIATIAVGYADGYPRHAAQGTPLLIAGQLANLVGTVSMDMITADISDCTDIKIGDPVELWGNNISADKVARSAGTIGYDLVTAVSQRVPRTYS